MKLDELKDILRLHKSGYPSDVADYIENNIDELLDELLNTLDWFQEPDYNIYHILTELYWQIMHKEDNDLTWFHRLEKACGIT